MESNDSIAVSQWNELSETEKVTLRKWAIKQGYELELVPGKPGTFDPVCDYATLFTPEQMVEFIKFHKEELPGLPNKTSILWKEVKRILQQNLEKNIKT